MRTLHRAIGTAGILAFLFTGVFLRLHRPGMAELDDGARMLFRSRHIYILLASLVNLGIGIYYRRCSGPFRSPLQIFSSGLMMAAPCLLIAAFFTEAVHSQMNGPLTAPAIVCLLVGTLLQVAAAAGRPPERFEKT